MTKEFVNFTQSSEERSQKYWLARSLGASASTANRLRDWRLSKIERFYHLLETYNPITKKYDRDISLFGPSYYKV